MPGIELRVPGPPARGLVTIPTMFKGILHNLINYYVRQHRPGKADSRKQISRYPPGFVTQNSVKFP